MKTEKLLMETSGQVLWAAAHKLGRAQARPRHAALPVRSPWSVLVSPLLVVSFAPVLAPCHDTGAKYYHD